MLMGRFAKGRRREAEADAASGVPSNRKEGELKIATFLNSIPLALMVPHARGGRLDDIGQQWGKGCGPPTTMVGLQASTDVRRWSTVHRHQR